MTTKDPNLIKEAELAKIKIEIEKAQEERLKIKAEREVVERDLSLKWYRRPKFIQAMTAAIVAVPLFWFYFKEFAVPFIQSENIKLSLRNEEISQELKNKEKQYADNLADLREEQKLQISDYKMQIKDIRDQYGKLDSIKKSIFDKNNTLKREFDNLTAKYQISEAERTQLKSRFLGLQKTLDNLEDKPSARDKSLNAHITKFVLEYFEERGGDIEFRNVEDGYIEVVVSGLKDEVIRRHWERLRISLVFFTRTGGDKVRCIIDGQYASGFTQPTSASAYLDMEPRYSQELNQYARHFLKNLKGHLEEK